MAIIGVVAALTIPTLINQYQEKQFKTAYKKAYSDFLNALIYELAYNNWPYRPSKFDANATSKEWKIIKSHFKVVKDCTPNDLYSCWAKGDTICGGSCSNGEMDEDGKEIIDFENGAPHLNGVSSFVDASGRSWAMYTPTENIYLVDTNGLTGPNHFGKDRWIFTFADEKSTRLSKGYPVKVRPYLTEDILRAHAFCKHPPCYYKSWLYN